MAKAKTLTYEELIALAQEHYTEGGDGVVECWESYQFDDYVKEFGPMTRADALALFRLYKSQEREMAATAW